MIVELFSSEFHRKKRERRLDVLIIRNIYIPEVCGDFTLAVTLEYNRGEVLR